MRIGRSIHPLSDASMLWAGQAVHTALTLYLYFIATALPPASYDATAASPPPPPPLLAASTLPLLATQPPRPASRQPPSLSAFAAAHLLIVVFCHCRQRRCSSSAADRPARLFRPRRPPNSRSSNSTITPASPQPSSLSAFAAAHLLIVVFCNCRQRRCSPSAADRPARLLRRSRATCRCGGGGWGRLVKAGDDGGGRRRRGGYGYNNVFLWRDRSVEALMAPKKGLLK